MTRAHSYDPKYALNAICPYFTMFPLEYPLRVLHRYRAERPIVMDPFCGRGTTLYAARMLKMDAWGVDSSPVAVAIARAKLANTSVDEVIRLAKRLLLMVQPRDVPTSDFFRRAFNAETLEGICALREGLLDEPALSNASVMLRAAVLGCLHGPQSKHRQMAGYLSNQMPRTFSPKPDYAAKYWKAHRQKARKLDILDVLRRKLSRISMPPDVGDRRFLQVRHGKSESLSTFPKRARNFSVVITSPPYYGMRTYVPDQWLRYWFLGGPPEVEYSGHPQLSHFGTESFAKALGKVWRNMGESEAGKLDMYVRFGVIPSTRVNGRDLFLQSLEESNIHWKSVYTRHAATADAGKRQAEQWNTASKAVAEYDFHVRRT